MISAVRFSVSLLGVYFLRVLVGVEERVDVPFG
jgi:hypothetical protein